MSLIEDETTEYLNLLLQLYRRAHTSRMENVKSILEGEVMDRLFDDKWNKINLNTEWIRLVNSTLNNLLFKSPSYNIMSNEEIAVIMVNISKKHFL